MTLLSSDTEIEVERPGIESDFERASQRPDSGTTFVCEHCGAIRDTATALRIHIEAEHPKRRSARAATGDATGDDDKAPPRRRTKSESKQIDEFKSAILDQFNPFIITNIVVLGVPKGIMQMNTPNSTQTVQQQIEFSEQQADIIARGVVKMKGTPVVDTVGRVVGPVIPYAFGLAALIVVVVHAINLLVLRQNLVKMVQNMALGQGDNGNGSRPQFV